MVPSSYPPPLDPPLPSSAPKSEGGYDYSTAIDPALRGFEHAPRSFDHPSRGYDPTPREADSAPRPVDPTIRSVDPQLRGIDPALRSAEQPLQSAAAYTSVKQEAGGLNTGEQQYPPRPRGGWNFP